MISSTGKYKQSCEFSTRCLLESFENWSTETAARAKTHTMGYNSPDHHLYQIHHDQRLSAASTDFSLHFPCS